MASAGMSPPAAQQFEFAEKEPILAYHLDKLYEAKILKVNSTENGPRYLIHYNGWNTRWNEWVDSSRILKHTPENVELQQVLKAGVPSAGRAKGANRKRKNADEENNNSDHFSFHLDVPSTLRSRLLSDHDYIVKDKQLCALPRPNGQKVADILEAFINDASVSVPQKKELTLALREYFDRSVGLLLLYKFERQQYSELLGLYKDKAASEIYGVDHFLRLFAKLPYMVNTSGLPDATASSFQSVCAELLKWIAKNLSTFPASYMHVDSNYLKGLKG